MAVNKTILQLPNRDPVLSDTSVFSDISGTFGFELIQLLTLLQANLALGAVITFGTASIPADIVGNNGDVYIKTDTGQFAQKASGTWSVVYTIVQGVVGSTIYYGSAAASGGINGDTYIQTVGGIFSKKIAGVWVPQFTMASGPPGPRGADGTNGTNGTNGNAVLHGDVNPSNLSDGINGDFYINDLTWNIFGPKTAGAWGTGTSLVGPGADVQPSLVTPIIAGETGNPLTVTYNVSLYPSPKPILVRGSDNSIDNNSMIQWFPTPVSGLAAYIITGDIEVVSGSNVFVDDYTFYIMP